MKNFLKLLAGFFVVALFINAPLRTFAVDEVPEEPNAEETTPEEEIEVEEEFVEEEAEPLFLVTESIVLPNGCILEDASGGTHIFPISTFAEYLAICALAEALEEGFVDSIEFADFGFGLFVNSVNEITEENAYWQLQKNGVSASVGVSDLVLEVGDVVSLVLTAFDPVTFEETLLNSRLDLTVLSLDPSFNSPVSEPVEEEPEETEEIEETSTTGGGGGSGGSSTTPPSTSFSVSLAVAYLKSVQNVDGSFGGADLYTDWVALALASVNVSGESVNSTLEYLKANNSVSSLLTDNERRAMALLALDENPYSFEGTNYIEAIVQEFDGVQFGDADLVNDDIFALIPLKNAGYEAEDIMIAKSIEFILSKQNSGGSWENSVDVTAAAVMALKPFSGVSGVSDALVKAASYLENSQGVDGGWGNVSSTSWAMQAEAALVTSWVKGGKSGLDYLGTLQAEDGAMLSSGETLENRIWATSYAIPAALGKPWDKILESVSKPKTDNKVSGANSETTEAEEPPAPFEEESAPCQPGHLFSSLTGEPCPGVTRTNTNTPGQVLGAFSQNIENKIDVGNTDNTFDSPDSETYPASSKNIFSQTINYIALFLRQLSSFFSFVF